MLDTPNEKESGSREEALCRGYFSSSELSHRGRASVIYRLDPSAVVAISSAGVVICKKELSERTCESAFSNLCRIKTHNVQVGFSWRLTIKS